MLSSYIHAAMKHAHFELMENGRFFGSIPGVQGVWSEGSTLEESRDELIEVLESWLFLSLRRGDSIPVMDGMDLNREPAYA
jgi:predicted RNase H-like HicB family nuclease